MKAQDNNNDRYLMDYDTKELVVLLCQLMSEKPKSFSEHVYNLEYILDIKSEFHKFRRLSEDTVSSWIERFINGEL